MKYERPIMNISMFRAESIAAAGNITGSVVDIANMQQAQIDGTARIMNKAKKALVVIEFID